MNPLAPDRPRLTATIGGERFSLIVARTETEIARGLMGVESMPADEGMWFELDPNDGPPAFWMANCRIPLDLAYLDRDGTVLATFTMPVEPMRPGEGLSAYWERLPRYGCEGEARYAVELNAGTLARLGVGVGGRVEFANP